MVREKVRRVMGIVARRCLSIIDNCTHCSDGTNLCQASLELMSTRNGNVPILSPWMLNVGPRHAASRRGRAPGRRRHGWLGRRRRNPGTVTLARHRQRSSKVTAGRHRVARAEAAIHDGPPELAMDLTAEVPAINEADVDTHAITRGAHPYPVSAFPMSNNDWRRHFGPTFHQSHDAKRIYDQWNVLTPGYEVFAADRSA
jgi:hypothetical protein